MNTSLIATLNKHYIYYINGNRLSFYIAIPYKDFPTTNISIELYPDYDKLNPNNSDTVWIKDEIIKIYKEIDNENISLVIPIFYDDRLKQTNNMMDQNLYLELDANISSTINSAYQILTKSNIKVDSKIILINNSNFNNFSQWFLQRYSTRVEYKTYYELRSISNNSPLNQNVQQPFSNPVNEPNVQIQGQERIPIQQAAYTQQPISTNQVLNTSDNPYSMNFVTGNEYEQKVVPPTEGLMNNTPNNENVEVPNAGSAGFVSYLLLGIITVIICLAILYIML